MSDNILEIKGITVEFPGVKALDEVDFTLKKGEIHALLGENGAGKSTLMKVLTGVNKPSSGSIYYDNQMYKNFTIDQSKHLGIAMIYQELNLVSELTIYENVFLGKEIKTAGRRDKNKMIEKTQEIFQSLGIEINPNKKVSELTMAYCQLVEIARALLGDPKILIMDEPTGPLTDKEVVILFRTMKMLKEKGVSLIYISHRLEEVFEVCDSCSIFRDGKFIVDLEVAETNLDELVRNMVGRELNEQYPPRVEVKETGNMLTVEHLKNSHLKDISFELKKGEILGFGGLVGAGRTECMRAIFGADSYQGTICKNGVEIKIHSPRDAINNKIVLVTEDRKGQGLLLNLDVTENIALPILKQRIKGIALNKKIMRSEAEQYKDKLKIKTPSLEQKVNLLSGGNQQKVIIARWLLAEADVVLFDEPTRGIDVGAKYEIYTLMNELKNNGKSIIMVSSDMAELMGMSDRIIVLAEGKITGEIKKQEEFDQELIMRMSSDIL